ncbi:MAG: HNH endonuclease [Actinobacteria bacterium]|nr:HNH endonuclease [Actinomycetota bacterium]
MGDFELEPYNRNVPADSLRDDIRRVAEMLGKATLTTAEYRRHGRFSPNTARRRFGSWFAALSAAGLEESRNLKLSREELVLDLRRAAALRSKDSLTRDEYEGCGAYSTNPFIREFGAWFAALDAAGLKHTRTWGVSDDDYFENLEVVWRQLGRQPRYADIRKPLSKYSAGAYEDRFGSWRKALEAFTSSVEQGAGTAQTGPVPPPAAPSEVLPRHRRRTPRTINWRLRAQVLMRDGATCRMCGARPEDGARLHVDHITPWSKDGETVLENLRILCDRCNIGKGDLMDGEG